MALGSAASAQQTSCKLILKNLGGRREYCMSEDPWVTDLAEVGRTSFRMFCGGDPDPCLDEIRMWLSQAVDLPGDSNNVLLDNTTVALGTELGSRWDNRRFTVWQFWDLCTVLTAIVTSDRIFHLEHPEVDSEEINLMLGNEQVFIPITYESSDPASALFRGILEECISFLRNIPSAKERRFEELWQSLLGVSEDLPAWNERFKNDTISSDVTGTRMLLQSEEWELTETHQSMRSMGDLAKSDYLGDYVVYSNLRGLFNMQVANLLGLPYVPNGLRLPVRVALLEDGIGFLDGPFGQRGEEARLALATIEQAHRQYADRLQMGAARRWLTVPFFPTAILNRVSKLSELFEVTAEMRKSAASLRRHKRELDAACDIGSSKDVARIQSAISGEGRELARQLDAPVVSVLVTSLPAIAGMLDGLRAGMIGALAVTSLALPIARKLADRVSKPQFWFLERVGDTARESLNSRSKIEELWNVRLSDAFESRLKHLSGLAHQV